MRDQATELRNLVLRAARTNASTAGPAPRLVMMTGGKGGVGVTTLAVNISVALAEYGARIVLVDANFERSDVATMCGLPDQGNVVDVMSGRNDVHEVLQRGPAGLLVLPGVWAPNQVPQVSEREQRRLLNQFASLGRHADLVLLDVGSGANEVTQRFWQASHEVVVVTTTDPVSIMDGYATVKTLGGAPDGQLGIIVNQVDDPAEADNVFARIHHSCQRFLACEANLLGSVPTQNGTNSPTGQPLVIAAPESAAALAIYGLAERLLNSRANTPTRSAA